MKKYFSFLAICILVSFGIVFGAPEDQDPTFQTFNEIGITNANIAANGIVNVSAWLPDGKLLIGGDFTLYKGVNVNRLARINNDGTLDTTFNPIVAPLTTANIGIAGGVVNTIAVVPGGTAAKYSIIVGGAFTKFNNVIQNRLAKIDCTSSGCTLDSSFSGIVATSGANAAVNAIAFAPGSTPDKYTVIVGGAFTKYAGFNQNYISRITCEAPNPCVLQTNTFSAGSLIGFNGAVNALALVPEGTAEAYSIIVGGAFTKYNNTVQNRLTKINCTLTTCTLDTALVETATTNGANNIINTLVLIPGGDSANYSMLIGGTFTKFDNIVQNRLAKISCSDDSGGLVCSLEEDFVGTTANDGANGAVETIAIYNNGIIVIGGAFSKYDNIARNRIAQIEAGGTVDDGFYNITPAGPDNTVQHLLIQPDGKIIVSGLFDSYTGLFTGRLTRLLGMTSSYSAEGCADGLFYCGFDNSCVANASQCASCPADFVQQTATITPATITPQVIPAVGTWGNLASSPSKHAAQAMVVLGTKIYVFGGYMNAATEVYDITSNTWQTLAPYPGSNNPYGIMAAAYNGKIYTFYQKKTYEYNPANDTWTEKASIPTSKAQGSAEVIDDKIYIASSLSDKKFHIYDPVRNRWTTGPDIPVSMHYTEAAVSEGKLYILGGTIGEHGTHKMVHVYDSCTQSWRKISDMTLASATHSSTAVKGEIYLGGGVPIMDRTEPVFKKFRKYNPVTGVSTQLPDMPFMSYHARSVAVGNMIYALGGCGTSGLTTQYCTDRHAGFAVYNTGATNLNINENISACYCKAACGEGKYYSMDDNTCRPNHELVGNQFCNKNNICDIGESCNCSDCTNGGLDDKDACGINNGIQMYCSVDNEFYLPSPVSEVTLFPNQKSEFLEMTNSAILDYSYKVPADKRISGYTGVNSQVATVPFGLPSNITLISRGGVGGGAWGNDYVWFSYAKMPGNSIFNTMASMSYNYESFDLKFEKPIRAFGIEIYEPHNPGAGYTQCNTTCTESTFSFRLLKAGVEVSPANNLTFSPANNQDQFFGFSTPFEFDEVQVREKTGSHDNERFGRIYYQDRSAGKQQCETKKVIIMKPGTSDGWVGMSEFFDYTPREVVYNGKKVYVYKPLRVITRSNAAIIADPSDAYADATPSTNAFDFMEQNLTGSNSATVFDNPNITFLNFNLIGRLKSDGTVQYGYNNAQGGYPFFARTPYTGAAGDKIASHYRDDAPGSGNCPGGICYWNNTTILGIYDIQICQPITSDICTIGACCPAGKKWDCDTNACIVDEFMCPAGQIKTPDPGGAVCLLSILPKTNGSDLFLTAYDNLQGNCTLASSSTNPIGTISPIGGTGLTVSSSLNSVVATTTASFGTILNPTSIENLLTCPTEHKTECFLGDSLGQFSCGCFPETYLRMKVNIVEADNVNTTVTLGNGVKVQNNTFFDVYKNSTYALDTGFTTGDTTDIGVNRQQGYVEFYTHDRLKYQNTSGAVVPGRLRGTITLEGAKIIGVDAPYQKTASLNLEQPNGDFVTQINDNTISFYSYFSEPGDKWKVYYELPQNIPEAPSYTCQIEGCGQGKYWCSDESVCKNASEACGVLTCNNDMVCDTEESCDCSDCNSQIDHCGVSVTGQQLYCATDRNTPTVCQGQAEINFNTIEAKLSPYLSQPGNLNIAAGEFGTAQTELEMTQDTRQDNAPSFTKEESWSRVKELLSLPVSTKVLWTRSSNLYSNNAYGGSHRYVHSFVIVDSLGDQRQITYATEYLPAYGWRKVYFVNKVFPLFDNAGKCLMSNNTDKWEAYSYASNYIFLAKHPIVKNTVAGKDFYVYNPERVIYNMTKQQFLANPTAAINNARVIQIGNTRTPASRLQFNMPQLLSETNAVQNTTITNLKSSILSRFLCKTSGVNSTDCHSNNLGAFIPGFSYTPTDTIYSSIHDGSGFVQTTAYQRFGTFDVACQPYDYTTVRYVPNTNPSTQGWSLSDLAGSAKNDAGKLVWQVADTSTTRRGSFSKKLSTQEVTDFFTKGGKLSAEIKNISSGTVSSPGNTNHLISSHLELSVGQTTNPDGSVRPRKRFTLTLGMDSNRIPIVYGLTDAEYNGSTPYKYIVAGGADKYNLYEMVYDPITNTVDIFVNGIERISNYPGNVVTSGNLQSANQINITFGSGSSEGIATTNYGEVKLTIKNNACVVSTSAVAQIGACCPAGAHWNSDENKCLTECMGDTTWDETQNKCVPNGCAEGQYYCHAELKCKPANQTCGTVTCNNNGTCDLNESCDCADCNGQIDHCGIVGGQQLYCAKDPAPQCYTDRFPYCFPICLDGYTLDTATNQCVASGGVSVSPNSAALSATQIGACCPAGAQWNSANNKCETNCNTTQAPSELKAGVDQPYISCTAGPTGTTHFKYRLTDTSAPTSTPFISAIYTNGTPVLHPVINAAGTYKVECFYGSATSVDTSNTATPSTCTKNITVKNDANTQGCEGLVSYKGNTLTTTLEDTNVFTARFQCINRVSENPLLINPFRIQYANNAFIPLGFTTIIDPNLSSSIGLNRLSAQNEYTFGLGQTSVTCAVKVGEGYSTNSSCQKNACVGANCSTPQTFSVVHSGNLTCTTQATAEYKIGCNPDAPQTNRTECVNWLKQMANNTTSFKAPFIFNGTLYGQILCQTYPPNDPALGRVNMHENIVCKATLNNGQQYTILAADIGGNAIASLQTTTYTVRKDTTNPDLLPLELYLNPTLTLQVTDFDRWYNVPVTLVARCSDQPGISDGDECACAQQIFSEPTLWSTGVAHTQFGPDIMYYTRTIGTSTNNISAQVQDTAGNKSAVSPQISLNIDTQPPLVAVKELGSGTLRTIELRVTDTNSKIWTTTAIPSGGQNDNGVLYRTGPRADVQTLMLDNDCGVAPVSLLPTVAQTVGIPDEKVITIPNIKTSDTVIVYCVKDNAGNVTRGSYPTVGDACFSASNMPTVPNFDTYKDLLITRLNTNKYGYLFSENTADAQCFRGILANNVATLIANQLTPLTETTLDDWDMSRALVKNSNNRNTNGYYYYSYTGNDTLKINTSPSDSGTKTVVVDGGNIQITQDINYSGTGKLLVLIARKNNNGQGGNILIDPTVSNIDAILIADGGALINTNTNAFGDRLIINGRVYSYNTRGGSLAVSGSDLTDATAAKKYNNASLINASSLAESRAQDLERFRMMNVDGNAQCSLHINYQVLTNSQLPPILQRPTSFGGSCGF